MTAHALPPAAAPALDFTAADRWPARAAAHLLGAGLVIAVLVALPVAPTDLDRHQLPKETIVHLVTWLAVLLARPGLGSGFKLAVRWSLLALIILAGASSVLATNGWLAFRATSLLITGIAALITARHLATLGLGPTLLGWCGVAGVVGSATGLAQAYGVSSPLFAITRVPGGTFGNRNFMAHFAGLTLPLLLLTATTARLRTAVLAMAGCALLAAAIILSRSRAAWIGSGTGVITFVLLCGFARRRQALPAVESRARWLALIMAMGVVGALLLPNRLLWRSPSPYIDTLAGLAAHDEGSGHGRVLQYTHTLRLALDHPILGVGPGNWPVRYGEVAPVDDPSWAWGDVIPVNPWPSSDWMALVSELGFVALGIVALLAASIGWRGVRAARSHGDRVLAGAALLALLTTLFVEGCFDAVLLLPASLLLVAVSIGALTQRSDGPPVSEPVPPMPRVAAVLPFVLGVIALHSTLQTAAYIVAGNGRTLQRLVWAGRIDPGSYPIRIALAQRLDCPQARVDIVAALAMAPKWPAPVLAARRCGVRTK